MLKRTVLASLAVSAALGAGCGDGATPVDAGAPTTFTAYESSFAGFHSWSSSAALTDAGVMDGLHNVGPMHVYWNHAPPHGAASFPVGTIIVKETEESDVTSRTVFAMVKRGGGFNASGAKDWEWFSLQNKPDGTVTILWGSVEPPAGETYANQAIGDCNGCHAGALDNDYVWDTALHLTNF